jgi:hypothetical protein
MAYACKYVADSLSALVPELAERATERAYRSPAGAVQEGWV